MKTKRIISMVIATFVSILASAVSQGAPPPISLSKAVKLAEEAISAAGMPSDCYLRSIILVEQGEHLETPLWYEAEYKPRAIRFAKDARTQSLDVIHITMDGKVSFDHEERPIK